MRFLILTSLLSLCACQSMNLFDRNTKDVSALPPSPEVIRQQEQDLSPADEKIARAEFTFAEKYYRNFLQKYPQSIYFQRAQLGLARSLEGQQKWTEATEVYRQVIQATTETQPEIAAMAHLKVSFCYDALGDETRLLSSLKDAERLKDKLPDEQKLAEIPARLAAALNRMGQTKEAKIYYQQAQRGVAVVVAKSGSLENREKVSQLYYLMGSLSQEAIHPDNIQARLDALSLQQTFLLRSIENQGSGWSKKAFDDLQRNYKQAWDTIQAWPDLKSMDQAVALRIKTETQNRLTDQLLKLSTQLRQYRSPETNEKNDLINALFAFLDEQDKQANQFYLSQKEMNPLTPDSQKRQGLKKEGVVYSSPQFPNEKKAAKKQELLPEKKVTDPNLNKE